MQHLRRIFNWMILINVKFQFAIFSHLSYFTYSLISFSYYYFCISLLLYYVIFQLFLSNDHVSMTIRELAKYLILIITKRSLYGERGEGSDKVTLTEIWITNSCQFAGWKGSAVQGHSVQLLVRGRCKFIFLLRM